MGVKRGVCGKFSADLPHHPKLISTAKTLELPIVYVLGHLTSMWLKALDFAEDGDLWRGNDEASLRFFESLAGIQSEPLRFLTVFQRDRWLDGWLIHDWLDYNSDHLVARHSSHNRIFLVETYRKYNRVYGKGNGEALGKQVGSGREVNGKCLGSDGHNSDPPNLPINNPITLNPLAPVKNEKSNPRVATEEEAFQSLSNQPRADFDFVKEGSRDRGYPVEQSELTGGGFTHKQVFEAFLPLLVAHAILTLEAFYMRVKRSGASPAEWIMLYLDKIHAVYRARDGGTLLDEDADPVAMTMAGLRPGKGGRRHIHTEAARSLFIEVMMDYSKAQKGGRSKWLGKMSGPTIVVELGRRKGKAGKVA